MDREAALSERERLCAQRERVCAEREAALAAQKPLLPPRVVHSASIAQSSTEAPSWSVSRAIQPDSFSSPAWTAQLRREVASASTERAWLLTLVATIKAWLRSHEQDGTADISRVLRSGAGHGFGSADAVLERCGRHFSMSGEISRVLARGVRSQVLEPLEALAAGDYAAVERRGAQLTRAAKVLERARVRYLSVSTSTSAASSAAPFASPGSGGVPTGSEVLTPSTARSKGRRASALEATASALEATATRLAGRIADNRRPALLLEMEAARKAYETERLAVVAALHDVDFARRSQLVVASAALEQLLGVAQRARASAAVAASDAAQRSAALAAQARAVDTIRMQRGEAFAARRAALLAEACRLSVRLPAPSPETTRECDLIDGATDVVAGWLRKQGSNLVKKWKQRWCFVRGGALFYQRGGKEDDLAAVHVVDILLCSVKTSDSAALPHTFEIHSPRMRGGGGG